VVVENQAFFRRAQIPSIGGWFRPVANKSSSSAVVFRHPAKCPRVARELTSGVDAGLRAYVEFGLRNPNDYRFAFMLRPPVAKRPYKVHGAFEALRSKVRQCVEASRFRAIDVETTAQALWASVHGITSLLIQRPAFPWAPRKAVIAQVINTAIDSLVAAPGANAEIGEHHANVGSP
jgi:hypothetical protein